MPLPRPTARLQFRRWQPGDIELATLLWGDPQVSRYLGGPYSPEQIEKRLQRHLDYEQRAGVQYWQLWLREGGEFVGCCGVRPPEDGLYEHGFHLRPQFWGQGLAAEACRGVIAHAFDDLSAAGLWAGHHPDNDASRKLLLHLGFRLTHYEQYKPEWPWHLGYHLWPADWKSASAS